MDPVTLAPFVPLFQTSLWVLLLAGTGYASRRRIGPVLGALRNRIERGSSFKAGWFEVGPELAQLPPVEPNEVDPKTPVRLPPVPVRRVDPKPDVDVSLPAQTGVPDWAQEREALYQEARHIFLTHVIEPSVLPDQDYDVFVYLLPHKGHTLAEVDYAEFFLGHYWGNQVFREEPIGEICGLRTSAYGPFLCTCRVRFKDGHVSRLSRYIDFEMGRIWQQQLTPTAKRLPQAPLPRPRRR